MDALKRSQSEQKLFLNQSTAHCLQVDSRYNDEIWNKKNLKLKTSLDNIMEGKKRSRKKWDKWRKKDISGRVREW